MVRDIWHNGFEIERDGQKIVITPNEIRKINNLIYANNGLDSLEYRKEYLEFELEDENDSLKQERIKEEIEIIEEMMQSEDECYNVWNRVKDFVFYDSSELEIDAIDEIIKEIKECK